MRNGYILIKCKNCDEMCERKNTSQGAVCFSCRQNRNKEVTRE